MDSKPPPPRLELVSPSEPDRFLRLTDETRSDAQQNERDEIVQPRLARRLALAMRIARVLDAHAGCCLDDVNDAARVCRALVDEFEP